MSKETEYVSISKNQAILDFLEDNKGWMSYFKCSDMHEYPNNPGFWVDPLDTHWSVSKGLGLDLSEYNGVCFQVFIDKSVLIAFDEDCFFCGIDNYFNDWTKPTQNELDYFEICEGYHLPWSEEQPFISRRLKQDK